MFKLTKVLLGSWLLLLVGCTLYPVKNPPTLDTTTSAEQHERIFWKFVEKQQWMQAESVLASTTVWTLPGHTLHHDDVKAYLQQQQVTEYAVRDVTLEPNGADMTVVYTLVKAFPDGRTQNYAAVSVWQQLKRGWVMILHSEQPQR